ncbi:TlpA family protein disulfide reductase [Flavisolibacter tropicus]|uniref:TlpA family protein disulfide reductase n=1 Tax=Flavisolibacter tropicus TaxID=1492898 RepID=UPI0009EE4362|nr:TlpA family protein disulfide reductase [Flavisolibacter tropicus]
MRIVNTLLALAVGLTASAQNAYEIKVTLKPFKNQYIYLGHYFGKTLPIIDSVKLNEKSEGVFKGSKKLGGGIYLIGYPDRSQNFEILVDKNQRFSVIADTATIAKTITFQNSPDNAQFRAYQQYMASNGKTLDALYKQRTAQPQDSVALTQKIIAVNKQIHDYRVNIMTKNPNSLLTVLLKAMRDPEVPKNAPEAKTDSLFGYHYFKAHYWDGVNFWDDRLARTPFFEARLDRYFEQLVYPDADSVIKELDWMLGYASISEDMQRFLLVKYVNRYLNQKYMWEDKVFVHLYEKYFSQKTYPWLNEQGKKVITDRAYSLMANIMGTPAADVELPDTSGKKINLYSVNSPYTLLVIWDPTCGHCKELVPKLDSLLHSKWKAQGVQMFGLAKETEGSKKDWMNMIHDHKLNDWVHVYYSKADEKARIDAGVPGYSQLFDVQSFPTLYLLDKDKRIIAKKVTEEQVDEILAVRQKNKS